MTDGHEELDTFDTICISAAIREAAGRACPTCLAGNFPGNSLGICVGTWGALHSDDPTGPALNPLAKWFGSNRAYQVFCLKKPASDLPENLPQASACKPSLKPPQRVAFVFCAGVMPLMANSLLISTQS